MKFAILITSLFLSSVAIGQNCCAPSVPQQGVLGEIATLPHTLEIGFHYEELHSSGMHEGSKSISDPYGTRANWQRATLTAAYGIFPRFGVSAIFPYAWKKKTRYFSSIGMHVENSTKGIGDITLMVRYSPLGRNFVTFQELSLGLGVKLPTGSTNERNFGFLLPEELQPGTGSYDFNCSISFFQGFEPIDIIVSTTYLMTTSHKHYEFGNIFSYIIAANYHARSYLDLSGSLMGISRGKDKNSSGYIPTTGRNQLWLSPGIKFQIIPNRLGLHAFYEHPVYQYFNGVQLGSKYNIRLTVVYTLQLGKSAKEE